MQSVDPQNGRNFWRKNSKVPGGSSPRKEGGPRKPETTDSFQDYQESVNDAWDCGDDEFCVISDVKISSRMVQSAALSVINSHRSGQLLANSPSESLPELHPHHHHHPLHHHHHHHQPPHTSHSPPLQQDVVDETPAYSLHCSSPGVEGTLPLSRLDPSAAVTPRTPVITSDSERDVARTEKFLEVINAANTSLPELRKLSWSGIPSQVRAVAWRLLNGYLPANSERREDTLRRKREEYWSFVDQYYGTRHEDIHQDTFRQIHIDIPRMSPLIPLFQQTIVQEMFERILYIWAIRHPASGYVQGINDLVTPFFIVFLHEVIPKEENLDTYEVEKIEADQRAVVEADSFWCMSKLLDGIQDNYTFAQPGIQSKVQQLGELMKRIDVNLHQHLARQEIDYLQFSFRWFNNLLMREMPLGCTVRLWDTLHAEPDGFSHFVLYVCAAFLTYFSPHLMNQRDFQGLMLLLQNLPTSSWSDTEISLLVAEAFRLKYTFADAPNHLQAPRK
ncbi:TBC1 domain family member 22B-like isoform X2 [Portunus trituberculatus]|uniref:TBC1 domain family member 22B-like isoform X2 n=1 Tax=Portunus trituberculatus TaxID=210409 RepID=UPI001E1CF6CE|nr:TBC1 domain family member 22B-like isoform X2 [Portunus trituberculatus]